MVLEPRDISAGERLFVSFLFFIVFLCEICTQHSLQRRALTIDIRMFEIANCFDGCEPSPDESGNSSLIGKQME